MSEIDPVTPAPGEQPAASVDTTAGTYVPPAQTVVVAPARKSRTGVFFLGALSGCAILFFGGLALLAMMAAVAGESSEFSLSSNRVAVIPVEGEIMESRDTIDALHRHADNDMVKAIVIRINSPGGAIAPSQEIFSEIRKTRERTGKPIVASMDSVAASGGYYIAAGCDQIVANPGTITGSIGVILQWMDIKDLVQWAKLKPETITSGEMKDAGSPYREMSESERAYFQRIVTQLHGQFVAAVAQGRSGKLTAADVSKLADGRVFTGQEAHQLKLVDQLGNLDDAVRLAGKLAGIEGEPTTIYPKRRKGGFFDLLDTEEASAALERIVSRRTPRFLYRW